MALGAGERRRVIASRCGYPAQIEWVGLDMSGAFMAGVREHLPKARTAFDHFQIVSLAGQALDEVRRSLQREADDLEGTRWAILGNEWTRSEDQKALRRAVRAQCPKLGRALSLKETLQAFLWARDADTFRWWCGWAARGRLARTLEQHRVASLASLKVESPAQPSKPSTARCNWPNDSPAASATLPSSDLSHTARLPNSILNSPNFDPLETAKNLYFPIVTCLLPSAVLSLLAWLLRR